MRWVVLAGVAAWPVSEAEAIVIRDDVADAQYVVDDADYPAVVTLFPPDDCAGTLIHEAHLLTVAHCAVDLAVGASLDVGGTPHVIAEVTLHPMWQDGDHYDIAVVRFEAPVAGVAPIPIHRGADELGAIVSIVGRGVTATGVEGEAGGSSDGLLRRATNVVTAADDFLLELVFDRPTDEGVTELEGVGASGDSGGPVFLEIDGTVYLAGLNSFGDAPDGSGIAQYGAWDYQTRVSRYADWIDEIVGENPSDPGGSESGVGETSVADDPSATAESGCGCAHRGDAPGWLLLFVVAARRRRARSLEST
jgi:hypothetical protein